MLAQNLIKEVVHAGFRVTDGHGSKRITMVAAPDCQHALLVCEAFALPVLNCHFYGDFDTDRA